MPDPDINLLDAAFPPGEPLPAAQQRITVTGEYGVSALQLAAMNRANGIQPRTRFVIDVETASELDLETVGHYRYAVDPSTKLLSVGGHFRPTSDVVALPWVNYRDFENIGAWLRNVLYPDTVIQAYNAPFDRLIWKHIGCVVYGWPDPDQWEWECLMQRAAYFNLPGGLDGVAAVLRTPRKDPAGHALMLKLCKPARPIRASREPWRLHTPENLQALAEYCRQDVAAEEPLDALLPRIPACEVPVIKADRAMNERGIRVDLQRVEQIRMLALDYRDRLEEDFRRWTRGAVEQVTQLDRLKAWLRTEGVPVRDGPGALDKYAIDGFLDGENYDGTPLERPFTDAARGVMEIRRTLAKSSLAKLDAATAAAHPTDHRIRGMFQWYGADRSGRWAARLVQPQNLPKGVLSGASAYQTAIDVIAAGDVEVMELMYGHPELRKSQVMDVLASCLRTCLIASPDHVLLVDDYNAIECRMAAWFAGETWLLEAFRNGIDVYKQMGSWIYGDKPLDQITKPERDDGKLAELSCQYGLGWRSLKKQAKQKAHRILTDDQSKHIVDTYRRTHARIKARWYELEQAAHNAVRNPGTAYGCGPVAFRHDGANLKLRLPVGRCITFHGARIDMLQPPWDTDELRPVLTYMGEDSTTHQWRRQTAWGGDFMAISCQGMARDLVASALVKLEAERFCPVLTVHDEIGCDVHWGNPGFSIEAMTDIMCDLDPWARGIPVKAEGFISPFYRK